MRSKYSFIMWKKCLIYFWAHSKSNFPQRQTVFFGMYYHFVGWIFHVLDNIGICHTFRSHFIWSWIVTVMTKSIICSLFVGTTNGWVSFIRKGDFVQIHNNNENYGSKVAFSAKPLLAKELVSNWQMTILNVTNIWK